MRIPAIPTLQVLLAQPQVTHDVLFVTFGAVTFWPGAERSGESSNSQFSQCSASFKLCSGRRKGNVQSLSLLSLQCCFQMPVLDSQLDINLQSLLILTSDSIPHRISLNTHLRGQNPLFLGIPPTAGFKAVSRPPKHQPESTFVRDGVCSWQKHSILRPHKPIPRWVFDIPGMTSGFLRVSCACQQHRE